MNSDQIVESNPFISLCLGSFGNHCCVSEACHKGSIFQRIYRKMTIKCVKFYGIKDLGAT